jgi:hypothetical protein
MRIGIITHPLSYNFGGILQNYAMQTVLRRLGHRPVTLNPSPFKVFEFWPWLATIPKRIYYKYYLRIPRIHLFEEFFSNKNWLHIMQNLQPFIDSNINYVIVNDYSKLKEEDFDALLTGSDQVWRPPYFKPIEKGFLNFAKDWKEIKRLSYAPSFGTDKWEYSPEQTEKCKELIQKFDGISVREESGVELCEKYFGVSATHVVDPTMLLSKDDYVKLFLESKTTTSPGSLLNYILDETPEKQNLIEIIAAEFNLKAFKINGKPEGGYSLSERIQPPMENWLRGFYDAEFVITDSFHACVFSIIFNKPFVVYGNKARGYARFQSLLSMFGLEDRIIYEFSDYKKLSKSIDWDVVNALVRKKKIEAFTFLQTVLN